MIRRRRTCQSHEKNIKMRQLCRISLFSSGEDLFQHVVHENGYGSLVHLGLIHYLSILYEEEIRPPKKRKRVSVYHNIQLDITTCYTFKKVRYWFRFFLPYRNKIE